MNEIESYDLRIRKAVPQIKIESITLNRDGLMNDVVIVNGEVVFRFPKHEYSFKHLKNETRILRLLRNYISLEIPSPLYEIDDALSYRFIPGEALRRDMLMRLSEDDQQAIADQLAQFFKELHGIPIDEISDFEIPMADALMGYDGWVNAYQRIRDKVFPLLLPHARDWVEQHFEFHLADKNNFEYELKMVDTDVPAYHILFDRIKRRINGIIDFGCAGLGDPAIDFGVIIYDYGESFLEQFYNVYPEAETYLKRARFYAGAHEVRWLLTGIERNEPFWFAVHIGSAKDMKYNAG
ncbi:MAG TPA: aminoglycoside phosphotransferase family protein [Blastocatellia bacterium]|nr:aminoglycoside phosphotransferase family protein [Blastocatellia bacterium]